MTTEDAMGALADDDTRGRRHALGRFGERVAAEFLEEAGWVVLSRNWHCYLGELDIIASDGEQVLFCEVKTRSGVDYGAPVEAVDARKMRRLRQLARAWLHERDLTGCPVRFDVISVLCPGGGAPEIEHHPEVF